MHRQTPTSANTVATPIPPTTAANTGLSKPKISPDSSDDEDDDGAAFDTVASRVSAAAVSLEPPTTAGAVVVELVAAASVSDAPPLSVAVASTLAGEVNAGMSVGLGCAGPVGSPSGRVVVSSPDFVLAAEP